MRIQIDELRSMAIDLLVKKGAAKEDAERIVEDYLDNELRGKTDHGFASFKKFAVNYLERTAQGSKPVIEKETDTYLVMNGDGVLGQIVCKDIINKVMEKARQKGIAMAGIYNMHSYAMPGTYARQVAENDMIGIITNYGGWRRIAPTGSIDPVFGTNPIAFGIPSNTINIVADMATSKAALAKVREAQFLGKKVPEGWGIDKDGNPTIEPQEILDGAVLPFGGHKGYALALVIEMLTKEMFDIKLESKAKAGRGYLFIVIDPSVFIDLNKFKQNVSDRINEIKQGRKAEGVSEIFVPGEKSERTKQENLKNGYMEIQDKVIEELKELSK